MTRYIILIVTALLLVSCNDKGIVSSAAYTNKSIISSAAYTNKGLKHTNIPIECLNELGQLDTNKGHDALDCDNL